MVGCPLQNRAWILPSFLNSLQKLEYPKNDIHLAFLDDGSTDNSYNLLQQFKSIFEPIYYKIDIWRKTSEYQDTREKQRDYQHFADTRNTWLSMRNEDDYLIFSVDSDILVPPTILSQLIKDQYNTRANIVSALIYNGFEVYNLATKSKMGHYIHLFPKTNSIFNVDVTGACMLITRETLDAGCSFNFHRQGEDVAFCESVYDRFGEGTIFCDTSIQPQHIMEKN